MGVYLGGGSDIRGKKRPENRDLKVQCIKFVLVFDFYIGKSLTHCP